jgi:hypothetical protein
MTTLRNWWARSNPFALRRDLVQGPIQPRHTAVRIISEWTLMFVSGAIVIAWIGMFP